MSHTTPEPVRSDPVDIASKESARTAHRTGVTLGRSIHSEILKLTSLRSSWWLLGAAVIVPLVFVLIWISSQSGEPLEVLVAAMEPSFFSSAVALVLVATLVATSEYEHHGIATTFVAVPRRTLVVVAKVVLVAVLTAVTALVAALLSFALADALLGESVGLFDPAVVRVVLGLVLVGTCSAVIALCVGLVVHSTIGAVAATVGFLYVLPLALQFIPSDAVTWVAKSIPGSAGPSIYGAATGDALDPVTAVITTIAWTLAWVVTAVIVVRRRDA